MTDQDDLATKDEETIKSAGTWVDIAALATGLAESLGRLRINIQRGEYGGVDLRNLGYDHVVRSCIDQDDASLKPARTGEDHHLPREAKESAISLLD